MYSTVVYDLDGTLVDSANTVAALLNGLRAERNLPAKAVADYKPWLSIGGIALVAAAIEISENEAAPFLATFRARYLALPTTPESVFPNVHATLTRLRQAGIRLALCTNKPRHLTEKILVETGLVEFFGVVCAGNDLPKGKPHPDNLYACLNALGSQTTETLVVGDSRVDQCLAEACGTDFAFFSGGYNDGVHLGGNTVKICFHPEILTLVIPSDNRFSNEPVFLS